MGNSGKYYKIIVNHWPPAHFLSETLFTSILHTQSSSIHMQKALSASFPFSTAKIFPEQFLIDSKIMANDNSSISRDSVGREQSHLTDKYGGPSTMPGVPSLTQLRFTLENHLPLACWDSGKIVIWWEGKVSAGPNTPQTHHSPLPLCWKGKPVSNW